MTVVSTGHTGSNVGGLRGDFHRVRLNIPARDQRTARSPRSTLNYVLPIAGPSNFTLTFGGQTYALAVDYARGAVAPPTSAPPTGSPPPGTCTAPAWSASTVYTAATSCRTTVGSGAKVVDAGRHARRRGCLGRPGRVLRQRPATAAPTEPAATEPASPADDPPPPNPPPPPPTGCAGLPVWSATTAYTGGNQVQLNTTKYRARWWTQGREPVHHRSMGPVGEPRRLLTNGPAAVAPGRSRSQERGGCAMPP